MELRNQPDAHRKRCLHVHGYSRRFPSRFKIIQLSPLEAFLGHLIRYIHRGVDVSMLLAFLFYHPFRPPPPGISVTTSTSSSSGLCIKISI
jgi:hypothetical protein